MISQVPRDAAVMEGEMVSFKPKVVGSPAPTVAWYFEGSMVVSDYAMEVSEDGSLTFVCVEPKHQGLYKFTVSNRYGSTQGEVGHAWIV